MPIGYCKPTIVCMTMSRLPNRPEAFLTYRGQEGPGVARHTSEGGVALRVRERPDSVQVRVIRRALYPDRVDT